jgi:hypothetical protein
LTTLLLLVVVEAIGVAALLAVLAAEELVGF